MGIEQFSQNTPKHMVKFLTLHHGEILVLINEHLGREYFLDAANIVITFPREIALHRMESVVMILKTLAKLDATDTVVKDLILKLVERSPNAYLKLKRECYSNS